MSKEVGLFNQQTTVSRAGKGRELSALAKSLASSSTMRRIQTNTNGTFKRLINGEQIGDAMRGEINLIIVAAQPKVSRIYYESEYDPEGEATLPNCWSNAGDAPEAGVSDAQSPHCADCPQNISGSGKKGIGRACRFQRRIAVLVEGDSSGDIYQFNVPAKSLFGKGSGNVHPFESYIKFLVHNGESPDNVVTKVAYDLNAETMELQFSPERNINDDEYALVVAAQENPEAEMYTKLTVAQADKVEAVPVVVKEAEPEPELTAKQKKKAELAAQIAALEEEDDDDEEETPTIVRADEPDEDPVPEPKKRKTKAKEEPAPESLESVVSAWAD